jgi:uncharacterized membrane protein YbhN (UPF0104 family)
MTVTRVVRHLLQVALLGFVAWYLFVHWGDYQHVFAVARPQWGPLLLSCVVVGIAYLVLIQTWRQTVEAWGERLDFQSAARIWFVSNLGKYVPGKVWAIAAMGTLAQQQGVSAVAAVGSSLVVQLVNLVTGFAVALIASAGLVRAPAAALAGVVVLAVAMLAAPTALPLAIAFVNRVTGRTFAVPALPRSAILWASTGTTVAWVLYGVAFKLFAVGITAGVVAGSLGDWTAIFIGPYLLGFIAVFAPGGIGVREVAMAESLQRAGLAVGAMAALLVAASRVWLTILEIIPGVLFLLVRPMRRSSSHID